ncbi:TonB-dependent receptor [Tamlana crocina]|uniref:TonB-dependent receptor n=1 Tax=Tamlana crocina TaxID=393006 RepID=A0ABX1DBC2_9FLAO|nr:TonB-dependent receptor [Tamlana crocina]NJX15653.1 TonB-dependent receptor [Tamlana crocina]
MIVPQVDTAKIFCTIFILLFFGNVARAQKSITSRILDFDKNDVVEDVSVRIQNTDKGTYSNQDGFFTLDGVADHDVLVLSKIGYTTQQVRAGDLKSDVYLFQEVSALKEVLLRSFSSSQLKRVVPDQIYLSQNDIEKLPFVLGEKDVIKLIQYTPGVQQASEGQSGILVRGGNASMNLTLLDNIYLHNTAHLGGLFSAVNSDFVNSLEFSKAGFDAAYGGRLSSVTDLKTLKQPDTTHFQGSIGLLSAKLTGNIKLNKKNSLLLSGRRSYLEIFKPFFNDENSILGKKKNYFLYDFLAKHDSELSEKSTLQTTLYLTSDDFKDLTKGRNRRLSWGNLLLGTTFKYWVGDGLSSQTTMSLSNYKISFSDNDFPYNYNAHSSFNVFGVKHHFLWDKENYVLKIGAEYNKNEVLPKKVAANIQGSPFEILNQETYNYDEASVFGDVEFAVRGKLEAKMGLRLTSYITKENALVGKEEFFSFEPRVSFKYSLLNNQALKVSYHRLAQFVHQASVGAFSLPADFFVVSTEAVKPQFVNQFSLGHSYEKNSLQLNGALYFKRVSNYTEFENGSLNNLLSNNLYDDILTGHFNSYGFEASLNKKINKLTAQASVTLSKTIAKFDKINQGNYFSATFDRPVNISAIAHYALSDRIELGALFIFTSGQNYTRPQDIRIVNERPIINFEAKNASRFPNYHRLDLSCTYSFKPKGRWNSKLNLTLYNAYNNKNLFQTSFSTEGNVDDSYIEIKENRDYLFPFLPTVNWLFSF